jgi:tetratricopeptide (TPR) repeat protein
MDNHSTKHKSAQREFKKGKELLLDNDYLAAKEHLKNAYDLKPKNAEYLSYYGLGIALSGDNPQVGIELCSRAIKINPSTPEFFLNLAKIYIKIKDRKKAMQTLKEGLNVDKNDPDILREFHNIGQRKETVLPFLSRNNIMNIYLGRLKTFLSKL